MDSKSVLSRVNSTGKDLEWWVWGTERRLVLLESSGRVRWVGAGEPKGSKLCKVSKQLAFILQALESHWSLGRNVAWSSFVLLFITKNLNIYENIYDSIMNLLMCLRSASKIINLQSSGFRNNNQKSPGILDVINYSVLFVTLYLHVLGNNKWS